jgi:hypothetical protein
MTGPRSGLGLVFEISIPELCSRQLLSSTAWEHQAEEAPPSLSLVSLPVPIRQTLEAAGVEFIEGNGGGAPVVRLRKPAEFLTSAGTASLTLRRLR